jgi:hypothetical protein
MDPVGASASAETIEVIDGELSLSAIALGEKDFYRTCSIVSYGDETVLIDGPLTFSGDRPVLAALDRAGKRLSKIIISQLFSI